ncbi:MAG: peptidase thermolysin, partial [Nocardioidaceae bacterium]|nr:peptidase thermolysin [Nocardioidaceae bacterium]
WDGSQMVFGDGDGQVFGRFTASLSVIGHELSHGVTQYSADLVYEGQPGALNESFSDVVGSCVKQAVAGETAAQADWLIGEGIFLPGVKGKALRSMAAPGTAYDDPRLGKDPQVGSMADYVDTTDDNGGVHLNSGIPNRAFQLAATAIGGSSADGAGRIWYAALTSGIGPDTDFAGFAAATVAAGGDHADAVRTAWETVGVTPGATTSTPAPRPTTGRTVRVVRSGGFAGIRRTGELDLDADDKTATDAARLLERIDFQRVVQGEPRADRFVYEFHAPEHHVRVAEQDLTADLRRLAGLVLDDGSA